MAQNLSTPQMKKFYNKNRFIIRYIRASRYLIIKRIKAIYIKFIEKIRIKSAEKILETHRFKRKHYFRAVTLKDYFFKSLITLIGISIGTFLLFQDVFNQNIEINQDLFYVCAGIIGTILALTFSLSALPIQKATESFGSTITDIYRKDTTFRLIFFCLSIFCLTSLVFGIWISFFNEKNYIWFVVCEIAMLSASLDLIKIYNDRSSNLLTPKAAIHELSKQARKYFLKHSKNIRRFARIQRAALSDAQRKEIPENDLNIFLYQANKNDKALQHYSSELFEIAGRSIMGRQTYVAGQALEEMNGLVSSYLKIYMDLFILKPATFGVSTSDANEALSPVFEGLKDLAKLSLDAKDELSYKYILRSLANIVTYIFDVEASKNDRYFKSTNWLSIGYLETVTVDAIENNFPDAGLEGTRLLNKIIEAAPENIDLDRVFRSVITIQGKLCRAYYKKADYLLAEYPVNGMMRVLNEAIKRDLRERHYLWSAVCEELKIIFPVAQLVAQTQNMTLLNTPLKAAHSATQDLSFSRLLAKELNACEVDVERPHFTPYHQFLECSEKLYEYMRDIARNHDFGDNAILYDLIELIGEVSDVFMHALENQLRAAHIDEEDIVRKLQSHHYFLSKVFYDKESINHNYATNAAKIAAKAGLRAYKAEIWGLPQSCRSIISGIAKSWNRSGSTPSGFDHLTDEFFEYLYMFVKAAELKRDTATINFVQADIETLINVFSEDARIVIRERLNQEIDNINERLNDPYDGGMDLDGLITILKSIRDQN